MPRIERLLRLYGARGLVVVTVNITPDEEPMVLSILRNVGRGFVPLRSPAKWAKETYKVTGVPTNFIVDRTGRVVFKPDTLMTAADERDVSLMLEAVLKPSADKAVAAFFERSPR